MTEEIEKLKDELLNVYRKLSETQDELKASWIQVAEARQTIRQDREYYLKNTKDRDDLYKENQQMKKVLMQLGIGIPFPE